MANRALELAELAAPDACAVSRRIIAGQIEGYAAEREAQARAEEREAASGLVLALDGLIKLTDSYFTYTDDTAEEALIEAKAKLDAYRATQTERKKDVCTCMGTPSCGDGTFETNLRRTCPEHGYTKTERKGK